MWLPRLSFIVSLSGISIAPSFKVQMLLNVLKSQTPLVARGRLFN